MNSNIHQYLIGVYQSSNGIRISKQFETRDMSKIPTILIIEKKTYSLLYVNKGADYAGPNSMDVVVKSLYKDD